MHGRVAPRDEGIIGEVDVVALAPDGDDLVTGAEDQARLTTREDLRQDDPARALRGCIEIGALRVGERRLLGRGDLDLEELLTDELQASVAAHSTMKYHAVGTGNTAEAIGDTALVTEVETRATGTQAENAANIYETVGTITATGARAIVEHGVFSASSVGTLLDRTVFSVVNLATNDSIQTTYRLTLTSGG